MSTLQIRIIGGILTLIILIGGGLAVKAFYDDYKAMKAKILVMDGVARGTEAVTAAAGTASQAMGSVTQHTVEIRTEYRTKYEELKNEDPTVAEFDRTPIPAGLRRLACERRSARDGLTSDEAGCGRFDDQPGESQ